MEFVHVHYSGDTWSRNHSMMKQPDRTEGDVVRVCIDSAFGRFEDQKPSWLRDHDLSDFRRDITMISKRHV